VPFSPTLCEAAGAVVGSLENVALSTVTRGGSGGAFAAMAAVASAM
jgi:hypothetical protein